MNENNSAGWEYFNSAINYQQGIRTAQLPKEAEISVTCNLLEKERAIIGGVDFGHAPRGDDGEFLPEESDKPFMPYTTRFSKGILVKPKMVESSPTPAAPAAQAQEVAVPPGTVLVPGMREALRNSGRLDQHSSR